MSQLCFSLGRCEDRHFLRGQGLLSVPKPGLCGRLQEWVGSPQIRGRGFRGRWGSASPTPRKPFESQVCLSTPPAPAAAAQGGRAALPAWFSYISRMRCWACHPRRRGHGTENNSRCEFLFKLGCSRKSSHRSCHPAMLLPQPLCVRECARARACQQLTPCWWIPMPEVSFEAPLAVRARLALGGGWAVARSPWQHCPGFMDVVWKRAPW